MPKLKPGTIYPTPDEDAAINAGIAADPDSHEWTADDFAKAKPASAVLPPEMYAALVAKRPRGRPKADETKVFTAIRLDADLLDAFKSTGKGWQTRVNAALRQYLNEHPLAP
ncbi:MAG: BrnA antitoxin family protein [Betaproteobacteria bacterium]|nr:BrnA antitoxin family protein [Betaproteobacteria bacterium]